MITLPITSAAGRKKDFETVAAQYGWVLQAFELEPLIRLQAARFAFAERFHRNSRKGGSLANHVMQAAAQVSRKPLARTIKLLGAAFGNWIAGTLQSIGCCSPRRRQIPGFI
jgi:hypothetical protein